MQRKTKMSLESTKCGQDPLTLLRITDKQLMHRFSLGLTQLFPLHVLFLKESTLGLHFSEVFCCICGF